MKTFAVPGFWLGVMLLTGTLIRPASGEGVLCGGWSEGSITNEWVISAANSAVKAQERVMSKGSKDDKSNPAKPVSITLISIVQAKQQLVAGMNYGLRLKVKVDGVAKEAEAVVWRKLDGEYELTSWGWK